MILLFGPRFIVDLSEKSNLTILLLSVSTDVSSGNMSPFFTWLAAFEFGNNFETFPLTITTFAVRAAKEFDIKSIVSKID